MRDEILVGMRNAIERGENIERAVQSFINAGYNPFEVREAAQLISNYGNSSSAMVSQEVPQQVSMSTANVPQNSQPTYYSQPQQKSGKKILIIGVIISAAILLSAIGFLVYTFLTKQ